MQHPPDTECVHIDISILPTARPVQPPMGPTIPSKLLAVMAKYKYNWRLAQLAKPKKHTMKYVPKSTKFVAKPLTKLRDELNFYADQLSKPKLRVLYENRNVYSKLARGFRRKFNKNINTTWNVIYNYYKRKERERKIRQLRQQGKGKSIKPKVDEKALDALAMPKHVFQPEPIEKPSKLFSNFDRLDELATPKPSHVEPPKNLGVSPEALTYEPTENVLKLAKMPARFLNFLPPLEPGKVKRGALKYKISPRVEVLAQPKQRNEKSKEDEDVDPWAISKNALKYKPTPRILELAKPVERN